MICSLIFSPLGKVTVPVDISSPVCSGHVREVNTVSSKKKIAQNSPDTDELPDSKTAPACPKDCLSMFDVVMIVGC